MEMRGHARAAGVLTPHILPDGSHLSQRETATVLIRSGLSPLGPLACNTPARPTRATCSCLARSRPPRNRRITWKNWSSGEARSAFLMTEPAAESGAGSDPSMMKTTARPDGNHWLINGRKAFITGYRGCHRSASSWPAPAPPRKWPQPCSWLICQTPQSSLERILDTIDGSMPGGHCGLKHRKPAGLRRTRFWARWMKASNTPKSASPPRASRIACAGTAPATRAQEIATEYVCRRASLRQEALIDHEGVGFQLADNHHRRSNRPS